MAVAAKAKVSAKDRARERDVRSRGIARSASAGVVLMAKLVIFALVEWMLLCVMFMAVSWLVIALGAALGLKADSSAVDIAVLAVVPGVFGAICLGWVWISISRLLFMHLVAGGWAAFRERVRP